MKYRIEVETKDGEVFWTNILDSDKQLHLVHNTKAGVIDHLLNNKSKWMVFEVVDKYKCIRQEDIKNLTITFNNVK